MGQVAKYIITKDGKMITSVGYDGYIETKAEADMECNKLNMKNEGEYIVEQRNVKLP